MKKILILLLTGLLFSACEIGEFDLLENPNKLTQDSADPNFLLNEIQLEFKSVLDGMSLATDDVMRYEQMSDTYADIAEPSAMSGEWNSVYKINAHLAIIENLAENNENILFHRGMAKLLNAYGFAMLVDYLGDIPYSEANDANNFNPKADDDAEIYPKLIEQIDLAIADINNAVFAPQLDMYYNGDASKWIKLANTLKFKMYLNMGDKAAIEALIASGKLIDNTESDFQFQYSTAQDPNSRHSYFNRAYASSGQSEYIGNYFMWLLKDTKNSPDPRLRYYIYRQTNTDPSGSFINCEESSIHDFCYVNNYYWGRDHGDDDSRPADRELKTIYGLYPGGGAFDADNAVAFGNTTNMGGAGILPIMLSSYVYFMQAEAAISLGTTGNPRDLLETAIHHSMDKVTTFSTIGVETDFAATSSEIDSYVAEVLTQYDLATSNDQKLDIIIREYYLAAFGNSTEAYNAYRRTGYPSNLQVPIKNETIPFPRTFSIPNGSVNTNTSINQRPITTQVFWDTLPAGVLK